MNGSCTIHENQIMKKNPNIRAYTPRFDGEYFYSFIIYTLFLNLVRPSVWETVILEKIPIKSNNGSSMKNILQILIIINGLIEKMRVNREL